MRAKMIVASWDRERTSRTGAPVTEAWTLRFDGSDPAREGLREALCTLGNGYLATRGALPERGAGGPYYPGTYAAGCYNRLQDSTAAGLSRTRAW